MKGGGGGEDCLNYSLFLLCALPGAGVRKRCSFLVILVYVDGGGGRRVACDF